MVSTVSPHNNQLCYQGLLIFIRSIIIDKVITNWSDKLDSSCPNWDAFEIPSQLYESVTVHFVKEVPDHQVVEMTSRSLKRLMTSSQEHKIINLLFMYCSWSGGMGSNPI